MIARDLVGYGELPPHPAWPGDAHIAVNFNLNVEGGGEVVARQRRRRVRGNAQRHRRERRSAAGACRWWSRCSNMAVAVASGGCSTFSASVRVTYQRARRGAGARAESRAGRAFVERGHEIVAHGYRWIDYGEVPEAVEREHIRRAVEGLTGLTGERPLGWMTGRPGPNTRRARLPRRVAFSMIAIRLRTSCPIGCACERGPHLVIPYSYETNDNRFNENSGFSTARAISSRTCATPSIFFIARARRARRSCSPSACTTG